MYEIHSRIVRYESSPKVTCAHAHTHTHKYDVTNTTYICICIKMWLKFIITDIHTQVHLIKISEEQIQSSEQV